MVPVDPLAASLPGRFAQVIRSERAHRREHSLEVQLPFLQRVLPGGFTVVPMAVGLARPAEVAEVIEALWDLPGTLVLVSTDLSHYLPASEAREVDTRTAGLIVNREAERLETDMACGHHPLAGLLARGEAKGVLHRAARSAQLVGHRRRPRAGGGLRSVRSGRGGSAR